MKKFGQKILRRLLMPALAAAMLPLLTAASDVAAVRETVHPQFQHAIPNLPGKSLITAVVEYPPGAGSAPHRHAASAFIYAYVLSGRIRSQVEGAPARVYAAGEDWYEAPGAHHTVSENASKTEPARLLAVFVVATGEVPLTHPDPH